MIYIKINTYTCTRLADIPPRCAQFPDKRMALESADSVRSRRNGRRKTEKKNKNGRTHLLLRSKINNKSAGFGRGARRNNFEIKKYHTDTRAPSFRILLLIRYERDLTTANR